MDSSDSDSSYELPPLLDRQKLEYVSSDSEDDDSLPPLVERQLQEEVNEFLESFYMAPCPSIPLDIHFPHGRILRQLCWSSFLCPIQAELAEPFESAEEDVSPTSGSTDAALVNNNLNFIFHSLSSCPQGIQQFPKALRISTVHEWQALPDAIKGLLVLSVPNQPAADPWRLFHIMKKCTAAFLKSKLKVVFITDDDGVTHMLVYPYKKTRPVPCNLGEEEAGPSVETVAAMSGGALVPFLSILDIVFRQGAALWEGNGPPLLPPSTFVKSSREGMPISVSVSEWVLRRQRIYRDSTGTRVTITSVYQSN